MKFVKLALIYLVTAVSYNSQTILDDILINDPNENNKGFGRTSIAAHSNGNFAVAWQDYNDYNVPVVEQPRIAVQLFAPNGATIGQLNLFQGESRSLSIWTSDYLDIGSDLAFTPDGTLLVAVEHEGGFSIVVDRINSSEVGFGAVNASGEIIDLSSENGVISWLISTENEWLEHPRISVGQNGSFLLIADGATYNTGNRAVVAQAYDSNGNLVGDPFSPHVDDTGPQANHRDPDVATNGEIAIVTWQDGKNDVNWDISAQFYGASGRVGNRIKVNSSDPTGTINVSPSAAINNLGQSVVVWLDTRENPTGEIHAQRFNSLGEAIGENIKVSYSSGTIIDRPEVAILNNGNFMVVWTDNRTSSSDISGVRALGRQFDSNGAPISEVFIVPNMDIPSGYVNISSNGSNYYCSWLDDRLDSEYLNVYAKILNDGLTTVDNKIEEIPTDFILEQNYPNPFNPATRIKYSLSETSSVKIEIYNSLGEKVETLVDKIQNGGYHNVNWDASGFSSGVYVVTIHAKSFSSNNTFVDSKKMLLMK